MLIRVFAAFAAICAGLPASAQSVTGRWAVTWDADVRIDHDTAIVRSRKPATLELTQRGDSVVGTWSAGPDGHTPVRGTFDGRSLKLSSGTVERNGMIDGKPTPMKIRWDIAGSVEAAKISGVLFLYMGVLPPVPRHWEAQRAP
jgi:hypothetical protein